MICGARAAREWKKQIYRRVVVNFLLMADKIRHPACKDREVRPGLTDVYNTGQNPPR